MKLLDIELKDMLIKILEGQDRLEAKVSGLETEVNKNSVKLESIEKKIDIISEVQIAHKEQNDRSYGKMLQEQENKNTLITASLQHVSDDVADIKKDIKDLNEKFDKVEKVTMLNTYDITYLKSVK